jgi:hypothetical protein
MRGREFTVLVGQKRARVVVRGLDLRSVVIVLLTTFLAQAQTSTVSGMVADGAGNPIEAARIEHLGAVLSPSRSGHKSESENWSVTDVNGRFQVTTNAPAIVIRKPGHTSQRLRVTGDQVLKVVLAPIDAPQCNVHPVPHWSTKKVNDVDYSALLYTVKTSQGKREIIASRGPLYSTGEPSDRDVWTSLDYYEVMCQNGVIDARGHSSKGEFWRKKATLGAAAQYYGVNAASARELDCVMDAIQLSAT